MTRRRGLTIRAARLSKAFGPSAAVEDLSFVARPGRVTGFVGPNGAGKSTTLRMITGLVRPDGGTATFDGRPYRELVDPMTVVGTVLDIACAHPGSTARGHLRTYQTLSGLDPDRVGDVLAATALTDAAARPVRTFSTGMRQRLALATALLGEPDTLVLDEPANGLDPAGIAWLRGLLRERAAEGGTVLVSSHLLSELQQAVDDIVLIHQGRLRWAGALSDFVAQHDSLEEAFLGATAGADR